MDIQSYKGRGGKREGSGRPATGRTTKVIRVPLDFPDPKLVEETLETLRNWEEMANQASPTSPRWEKLRQMLQALPSQVFEED